MSESNVEYFDPFGGKLGFALASRSRGYIHVSGMTGFNPDMSVPEDLEEQMRLAYTNIENILTQNGASFADAVEQIVFVVGDVPSAAKVFDKVSKDLFGTTPPPCTMVGTTGLVDPRYKVEIKVTAVDPNK